MPAAPPAGLVQSPKFNVGISSWARNRQGRGGLGNRPALDTKNRRSLHFISSQFLDKISRKSDGRCHGETAARSRVIPVPSVSRVGKLPTLWGCLTLNPKLSPIRLRDPIVIEAAGAHRLQPSRSGQSPNTHTTVALPCMRNSGVRGSWARVLRGGAAPGPAQQRPDAMAMYCLPLTA